MTPSLQSETSKGQTMNSKRTSFLQQTKRLVLALAVASFLIPASHSNVYADAPVAPAYIELNAVQLDQLVAPIALDPDPLVAQILTASTYPDQVAEADKWLNDHMNLTPDQRATGADQMSWDPAVKGLIEFPSTLDSLAKNSAWTAQLGNAYYNQPGDVENAIQAMRLQAEDSNKLVTTAQQKVVVENDVIEIVPVNPTLIYVPYYNPWVIWGGFVAAYPGYIVAAPPVGVIAAVGVSFDPPVAVGVYAGFGWGFAGWAPDWGTGSVVLGGATYVSNSVTVINHGRFGYHDHGAFDHGGRGVPGRFHPCAHGFAARDRASRDRDRMTARDRQMRDDRARRSAGGHNGGRLDARNHPDSHGRMDTRNHPENHTQPNHPSSSHNPVNRTPSSHNPTPASHNPSSHTPATHTPSSHGPSRVGPATSNRTSTANNRSTSSRPTQSANRTSTPNRATPSANRTPSASSRNTSAANRQTSSASRATPSASHASAPSCGRGK
jgi:Protein of unknown function (DUF3300)